MPPPGTRRRCHSVSTPISPPPSEMRLQEEEEGEEGQLWQGSSNVRITPEGNKFGKIQIRARTDGWRRRPGAGAAGSLISCFHLEQAAPKAAELAGNMSGCAGQDGHPGQGMSEPSPGPASRTLRFPWAEPLLGAGGVLRALQLLGLPPVLSCPWGFEGAAAKNFCLRHRSVGSKHGLWAQEHLHPFPPSL